MVRGFLGRKHTAESKAKIGESVRNSLVYQTVMKNPERGAKISERQFGRKNSTETRAKISEAARHRVLTEEGRNHIIALGKLGRGRKKTAEHRMKIGLSNLGKHFDNRGHLGHPHSPEAKAKIGMANRGRKQSLEEKAKRSITRRRGEKSHLWRGGTSTSYNSGFNNDLRAIVRERDGYLCQNPKCYLPENGCAHDVHHVDYDKRCNDPTNLITLCHRCHSKTNRGRRDYWTEYYQALQVVRGIGATMELRA